MQDKEYCSALRKELVKRINTSKSSLTVVDLQKIENLQRIQNEFSLTQIEKQKLEQKLEQELEIKNKDLKLLSANRPKKFLLRIICENLYIYTVIRDIFRSRELTKIIDAIIYEFIGLEVKDLQKYKEKGYFKDPKRDEEHSDQLKLELERIKNDINLKESKLIALENEVKEIFIT
ncbi:MAG: hypothetical protein KDK90_28735 [Leptospiraceae bacterium]|nr:hypothetical protein [Leptospiraceae bacterium]